MTIWENFTSQLTSKDKAMMICEYYQNIKEGHMGSCCTNECPFKKRGDSCKIYNKTKGKLVPDNKLEKILNSEGNESKKPVKSCENCYYSDLWYYACCDRCKNKNKFQEK